MDRIYWLEVSGIETQVKQIQEEVELNVELQARRYDTFTGIYRTIMCGPYFDVDALATAMKALDPYQDHYPKKRICCPLSVSAVSTFGWYQMFPKTDQDIRKLNGIFPDLLPSYPYAAKGDPGHMVYTVTGATEHQHECCYYADVHADLTDDDDVIEAWADAHPDEWKKHNPQD